MDNIEEIKSYTLQHIKRVRKRISYFVRMLEERGYDHDKSKLEEPEVLGWAAMDQEPKYPYGSPEYYDKMRRYKEVFNHHYSVNRHHPEYFFNAEQEMNLVDLIEMLCDWFSYKEEFTYEEGYSRIQEQCERFKFSPILQKILLNTFKDFILNKTLADKFNDVADENYKKISDAVLNNVLINKGIFSTPDDIEELEALEEEITNLDDITKLKFYKNDLKKFCEQSGIRL